MIGIHVYNYIEAKDSYRCGCIDHIKNRIYPTEIPATLLAHMVPVPQRPSEDVGPLQAWPMSMVGKVFVLVNRKPPKIKV